MPKNVNYSYWEIKQYFTKYDLIIIGSGIVGLSTAISFKEKHKKASVLVIERGILPSGASTKNAGFACFGSPSELLDDLSKMREDVVWETVKMRWDGLNILHKRLGSENIGLQWLGGYELFDSKDEYDHCLNNIPYLNKMIKQTVGLNNTFNDSSKKTKGFGNIRASIVNRFEGQLDTGKMMANLLSLAQSKGIKILNGVSIHNISDVGTKVELESDCGTFNTAKVVVATNGFAKELLKIKDLKPARAQVLVTKPIKDLKVKGAFHYQQGYFYFRNIDSRILFGGGRNLDFEKETGTEFVLNKKIHKHLDRLLKTMILPGIEYEIEQRWVGIMGVGSEKKPIIEHVSKNVVAAVRMGGMGVAIGSLVGKSAAEKVF